VPEPVHRTESVPVATPVARPAHRYGDRTRTRRWAVWLGIAGLILVAAVGWLLFRISTDAIRSSLVAWETPTAGVLPVTVEVVRRPGTAVTCELVALDIRRVVVGQVNVDIPASDEWRTQADVEIPLHGDAVVPDLRQCEKADQR
jgi:Domain of unknown function (DUF4307)